MSSNKLVKRIRYSLRFLPDELYIQLNYFLRFKKLCNLKSPRTFNEKLNWLKLNDHNPIYPQLVDKYTVKEYVADKIGEKYIIPTLGLWEHFDDIDFDSLPEQFVLKCTHDSEGLVIVKDKSRLDKMAAKKSLEKALKQNFYYIGREWPYKSVKPRIIAETYIEDYEIGELRDYKFYCFNGEPKVMFIASDRESGCVKFDFFDMEFNHLDIKQKSPNSEKKLNKPRTFEKMIEFAKILSKGIPHVRVDFYEVCGELFFGELTFYDGCGFMPFQPDSWDHVFGDWLDIPS